MGRGEGKHANKWVGKAYFSANLWIFSPAPFPTRIFSSLSFHIPTNKDTSDELLNLTISLLLLNFILPFVPNIHSSSTPFMLATSALFSAHSFRYGKQLKHVNTAVTCYMCMFFIHMHISNWIVISYY